MESLWISAICFVFLERRGVHNKNVSWYRGNMYLASLSVVNVRCHRHVILWKSRDIIPARMQALFSSCTIHVATNKLNQLTSKYRGLTFNNANISALKTALVFVNPCKQPLTQIEVTARLRSVFPRGPGTIYVNMDHCQYNRIRNDKTSNLRLQYRSDHAQLSPTWHAVKQDLRY